MERVRWERIPSSGGLLSLETKGRVRRCTTGRTDSNIPTGPNETVRVAKLLLNIYLIETKGQGEEGGKL